MLGALIVIGACGDESDHGAPAVNAGDGGLDGGVTCPAGQAPCNGQCLPLAGNDDKACGAGTCTAPCTGGEHCLQGVCTASKIEHVVLIVQENHTFDNYFGKYCTAPSGSPPACTNGRAC